MKIAIIGYGRMGHMIEEEARKRGHEIVCTIDQGETDRFNSHEFKSADVAIEFSRPDAAVDNYLHAFAAGVPVVSGTTGWLNALPEISDMCEKGAGTLFYASNFSLGVNIFAAVNGYLANIMNGYKDYKPSMLEIHHIHKLDHPSGTAITLAEGIINQMNDLNGWEECEEGMASDAAKGKLPIAHRREGEVPGIHSITWESDCDSITLTHSAKSRRGFALGAVVAAEWLKGKPAGYYTMQDMLKF